MSPRGTPGDMMEDGRPKLFVLCGSYNEFRYWSTRINTKTQEYDIIYASEERRIRGYRNENYICLGNWFQVYSHTPELMMEIMRICDFKELHYSDIFEFESEEAEREFYETPLIEEFLKEEEMWI